VRRPGSLGASSAGLMGEGRGAEAAPSKASTLTPGVAAGAPATVVLSSRVAYVALCALAVVLGAALRLLGYFDDGLQLWLDEATWAIELAKGNVTWIRPLGYMELTALLIGIVNNEQALRFVSLVGGLLHVPLALAAFRLSTSSRWIALFGAYIVAIHPTAVSMSKEFKPYAVELTVALLLLCFALAYLRTDRRRHLVGLVTTSVVAPLLSWSAVFAFPAVFAVAGARALRDRRVADLLIVAAGAAVTLAVLAAIFFARVAGEDGRSEDWGEKYDVFYVDGSRAQLATWLAGKTIGLASFPAHVDLALPSRAVESAALGVLGFASIALCTVGALALVARRQWAVAALWIGPWLIAIAFNLIGQWPWGVFRTNLFMLAYATGLLCHGLVAVDKRVKRLGVRPWQAGALGLAALALLAFPFDASSFATKPASTGAINSSVRTAMERIHALEPPGERREPQTIALDTHACSPFFYYADYHAESSPTFNSFFSGTAYQASCARATLAPQWSKFLLEKGPFPWVISAKPSLVPVTRDDGRRSCEAAGGRVDVYEVLPAGTVLMHCATDQPPDTPNP
jgi:hypothetical protein